MKKDSYLKIYLRLWNSLPKKRKRQILFGYFLIIISSFMEMLSLISVFPLLQLLISEDANYNTDNLSFIIRLFSTNNPENLLSIIVLIFLSITISSGLIRLFNSYYNFRITALIGSDISSLVFKNTIYKPYQEVIKDNSGNLINAITSHISSTVTSMKVLFNLLNFGLLIIFIIIGMLSVNFNITILSLFLFSFIYLIITLFTRKRIYAVGKFAADANLKIINYVQEALGSLRDIIIDNTYSYYINSFDTLNKKKYLAVSNTEFLVLFPRYLIESLGLTLIALIALFFKSNSSDTVSIISVLGSFALGVQKLLPAVHQVYSAYASIKYNIYPVNIVLDILDNQNYSKFNRKLKKKNNFIFKDSIEFKNVSFSYDNKKTVLNKLSFKILKGEKIGIIGKTGCGKSTLVDLIMGLLVPSSGSILIDKNELKFNSDLDFLLNWRNIISHVPQEIFISDTNFLKNIAFGIEDGRIDEEKVRKVCRLAKISEYIDSTNNKLLTKVGERGVQLSGGQKQRIGISRAFYKNSQIIIFDEATSALDNLTEKEVMESLYSFNSGVTLIMIAHRLSSIMECDKVIYLKNGNIEMVGKPYEVIEKFNFSK